MRELTSSSNWRKVEDRLDSQENVKKQLKHLYFQNKEKLLKESRFLNPEIPRWEPIPEIQGKEEEKRKAELDFEESLHSIFTHDTMDVKLSRMEQRLRLVNKEAISYDEIMIKVDQMLSKIPEGLRRVFESDSIVDTVEAMGEIEYSQQDLMWKNFTTNHYSVWPAFVAVDDDRKETTEFKFMEDFEEEQGELYSSVVSYMTEGSTLLYKGREKNFDE